MKIINTGLVLVLCALVIAEQEQPSEKDTRNNGDVKEGNDDSTVKEDVAESGSAAEVETDDVSEESGSGSGVEDEGEETLSQPQMPAPKPMKFKYFGFRGPVTITPMEPMVNRQRPFRRRCFFCFPRGRLGRVEMTPPGGPYLMNGLGPVNRFGPVNGFRPINGFGMGYPDMGFPEPGPEFPAMGGFGGPCCGGPCCGGPCCGGPCCGGDSNQGPMIFEGINEEEPKKAPVKVHDKPMQQASNKGAAPAPNKVMDQGPNKAAAPTPNKVMDQASKQASNKVASNEPTNPQTAEKLSDKTSKTKPKDEK